MQTETREIKIVGASGGWIKLTRQLTSDGAHYLSMHGDGKYGSTVSMQVWDHDLLDLADELVRFAGGPRQ
jgi:hypothetical protein